MAANQSTRRRPRGTIAALPSGALRVRVYAGTDPVTGKPLKRTGRCRSEAAFTALAGASPLEASSGRTTRHRLNRGGDRALNRALHTIAMVRMRADPTTRAYVERRKTQGKSPREIRRCLKRYIARQLHRQLTTTMASSSRTALLSTEGGC